jgi:hypothetical protein
MVLKGARLEQPPKHLEDEDLGEKGPVKWEDKF